MTVNHENLVTALDRLRLTTIRDKLDNLLDEAARQKMNLREALVFFCEQEMQHREETRHRRGFSIAKFPYARSLEQFDFGAQPSLDAGQIRELGTCRWVANGDSLLLLGPPGVGKTHLAVALGHK